MATIDVLDDTVVVGGVLRSLRFAMSDIDRFMVVPRVNLFGIAGDALALRMRDGETKVLGEFWSPRNAQRFSVQEVAEVLNEWIPPRGSAAAGKSI